MLIRRFQVRVTPPRWSFTSPQMADGLGGFAVAFAALQGEGRWLPGDEYEAMSSPDTVTVGPSPFKVLGHLTIATVAITGGAMILVVFLELLAAAGLLALVPLPPWLWLHHRAF